MDRLSNPHDAAGGVRPLQHGAMPMTRDRRHSRGVSTAEVLVGSALSLVTLAVLCSFFQAQERAQAAQSTYNQSQVVTRSVIDLLSRELRMATYDPTGAALPTAPGPSCPGVKQGIVEATATRLHFRQDLDGDGALTTAGEDLLYDVSGTQLRRQDGAGAPVPLVDGVAANGLQMQYFDGSNPPVELLPAGTPASLTAAQRNCVAKVRVTITASLPGPDPANPTPRTARAESEIAIRNRSLASF